MKNGKRLSRKEKIFLKNQGFIYDDYLKVTKTADCITFVNRNTGNLLAIRY